MDETITIKRRVYQARMAELDNAKARLAEAERRLERIRGVAAEPGQNYVIRLANIVTIIDAPDGFSGPTDSASVDPEPCDGCGAPMIEERTNVFVCRDACPFSMGEIDLIPTPTVAEVQK